MISIDPVFLGLATLGMANFVMLNKISKEHRKKRHLVAKLTRITLFPVKSMRGVDVKEAECTYTGLRAGGFRDRLVLKMVIGKIWSLPCFYYIIYVMLSLKECQDRFILK